jgi:hypothetical protein
VSAVTKTHKEIGGEIGEEDAALRIFFGGGGTLGGAADGSGGA